MSETIGDELKDQLLAMYLAGYSQKDIADKFQLSRKTLRTMLHDAGMETRRFRALDYHVTDIIILLITHGVQFKDVEEICDISFHAIRDVVARHNLQRASKRARYHNPALEVPEGFVRNSEFLERYQAGESFCALCKDMALSNDKILYEFLLIEAEHIAKHQKMLRLRVHEDAALHFSPTAIARKQGISMGIVRKILQEQKSAS